MSPTRAQILAAINAEPKGITTIALAAKFGAPRYSVSAVASKLASYGLIASDRDPNYRKGTAFAWKRKLPGEAFA